MSGDGYELQNLTNTNQDDDIDMSEVYIRKSMLGSYSFCPHRFNIDWMRPGLVGVSPDLKNWIMAVGTRFHDFAWKFWDFCDATENWPLMIPPEFSEHERSMAMWFLEYERDRKQKLESEGRLDEWKPILRETKLVHKPLKLSSTFDRADWWNKDNDEVVIVEYKTGNSYYPPALKDQLAFYAMLWEETMNFGTVTKLIVINPNLRIPNPKITGIYNMTGALVDKTLKDIAELRSVMKAGGPWPHKCTPKKYAICKKCHPSQTGLY